MTTSRISLGVHKVGRSILRRGLFAMVIAALLQSAHAAQDPAGTLKSLRGQISIEREGAKRPARAGEPLYAADRILTGADGYASVGLRDQSSIAIGPNSDVNLTKYSFNPTTHQGTQQVGVRTGSLAAISGKMAKASPESVQFNAGSVTLGVRGTAFVVEMQSGAQAGASLWRDAQGNIIRNSTGLCWQSGTGTGGCPVDRFVLLPDRDGKVGAITLRRESATVEVNKAYAGAEFDEGAGRSTASSEAEINARYRELLAAVPPAPRTFVVRFVTGSAEQLEPGSQTVIDDVKEALARWPMVPDVDVVGHTDTVGRPEQNDALSVQRARTVSQWITSEKLSPDRLHISGRGERQLLVQTPDEAAEPRNRRVEITIH